MDHSPPPQFAHVGSPPPAPPLVHRPLNYGALGQAIIVIGEEVQHAAHGSGPNEFHHLRDGVNGLIDGINLLSRNLTNDLNQLGRATERSVGRLERHVRRVEHRVGRLEGHVGRIEGRSRRLENRINMMPPLCSFNASRVPVLYPYPHQPGPFLPRSKGQLERISGVGAQRALERLGFRADAIPATAQGRKDMLPRYLEVKVDVVHEGEEEENVDENDDME